MRITFVHLGRENLGIEYISACLKDAGHEVRLVTDIGLFGSSDNVIYNPLLAQLFDTRKKILKEIEKSDPDLVAFSVYTATYRWALDIAGVVKEKMGVRTVFGGVHATLVPGVVIKEPSVDFLIVGEGEYAMLDLVDVLETGRSPDNTKNLWYKHNGDICRNELGPLIKDLDSLPLPDKKLFDDHIDFKYEYLASMSRGCVYHCSYCAESHMNKLYGRFYRRKSAASAIRELKIMKDTYNFKTVRFIDPIFISDKRWAKEFIDMYKKEIDVPFQCFGHVNFMDEEMAELLKSGGCDSIDFGLQTTNERIRKEILNCPVSDDRVKRAFDICDSSGLRYFTDHLFNIPGETEQDLSRSAEIYAGLKSLIRVKCFYLTYYPKMKILEKAEENNIITRDDIEKIESGITDTFFSTAGQYRDKDLVRRNKGYVILYTIIPVLPRGVIRWILKRKIHRLFYMIPDIFRIVIIGLSAFKTKEIKYAIYLKQYPRWIFKLIMRKLF